MTQPAHSGHNPHGDQSRSDTPDKHRNPRAGDKGPDMHEDHGKGHRTDPEEDYEKPDGTGPRRGLGGP